MPLPFRLLVVVSAFLPFAATAQSGLRRNAVTLDVAGGFTIGVGANYHRVLLPFRTRDGNEVGFLSGHVGVGFNAWVQSPAFSHGASLNLGSRGNYFEVWYTASYATHAASARADGG
jgi:hypothetical protein